MKEEVILMSNGRQKRVPEGRFNLPDYGCHLAIFGETGAGKSVTLKVCAEIRYEQGWKLLDIYDGASEENCYYCLKSNHSFWNGKIKRGRGPTTYPLRILTPIILSKLPKKLPDVCIPFRIRICDFSSDDLKALIGKQIPTSAGLLWGIVSKHITKKTTGIELLEIIKKAAVGGKGEIGGGKVGLKLLYNIIEPMVIEGLLCAYDDDYALDMLSEIKDRKTISSLMLKYVPPQLGNLNLRSFLVQHIIRKTFELKQKSEGNLRKMKTAILMREATDFLAKGGAGDLGESDMAVRDIIAKVFKQGRKFNLFGIIDAQSPSMLASNVQGQFKIVLAHQISDYDDLDNLVSPSVKDQVTPTLKWAIGELPNKYCAVLKPRDKRVDGVVVGRGAFITKILPPRSRLMEAGEDFIEIFFSIEENKNRFILTKEFSEQIKQVKEEQEIEIKKAEEFQDKKEVVEKKIKKLPAEIKIKREIKIKNDILSAMMEA